MSLQVDEDDDGMLDFEETLMGLKGINRGLSDAEQEYIYRVSVNSQQVS